MDPDPGGPKTCGSGGSGSVFGSGSATLKKSCVRLPLRKILLEQGNRHRLNITRNGNIVSWFITLPSKAEVIDPPCRGFFSSTDVLIPRFSFLLLLLLCLSLAQKHRNVKYHVTEQSHTTYSHTFSQSCWSRRKKNSTITSTSFSSSRNPRWVRVRVLALLENPRRVRVWVLALRERVLDRWTLDRWTEHWTQNTSSVKVKEMASSFRSILQKEHA